MTKPDAEGWVRCTLPIEGIEAGVRDLMRLGDDVEVLGPPVLRKAMTRTLDAMRARHDD
jgi:predicted DNA-binding transcriptional regulator YafY